MPRFGQLAMVGFTLVASHSQGQVQGSPRFLHSSIRVESDSIVDYEGQPARKLEVSYGRDAEGYPAEVAADLIRTVNCHGRKAKSVAHTYEAVGDRAHRTDVYTCPQFEDIASVTATRISTQDELNRANCAVLNSAGELLSECALYERELPPWFLPPILSTPRSYGLDELKKRLTLYTSDYDRLEIYGALLALYLTIPDFGPLDPSFERIATDAIALATQEPFIHLNAGAILHQAHTGLGLLRLYQGDLKLAEKELNSSISKEAIGDLQWTGPNTLLANEFIARAHPDQAVRFLKKTAMLIPHQQQTVGEWLRDIARGDLRGLKRNFTMFAANLPVGP